MALSINPVATLTASVSKEVSAAASQANAAFTSASTELGKLNLSDTVGRLSGEVGSALNGFASDVGGAIGGVGGGLGGAIGGIANQATTLVASVGSAAGSISNVTADIASSLNKLGTGGGVVGDLANLAGSISKAAGQLNNLLSLKRGQNLPSNAELFQSSGALISVVPVPTDDWRVRITSNWDLFNSPLFNDTIKNTNGVVWPYLPDITINTSANYNTIDPVHNNYPFQAYKNSQVSDITISGDFSCETDRDAYYWIAATTFFKTVTKMFYGSSSYQGNPPPVCQLAGYGRSIFNSVPVLVKSFDMTLSKDVNYIKCSNPNLGSPTWVPVLSTISVTVTPIYNRSKLRQFSLQDYASGNVNKSVGYL
jgi:hypothetical protein